ncbi:hypothetical protein BRADI_3g27917v3 [Brachypodium distachyon]|uniref:Uncharacterized protein n=1 Tax=Brachypodium distachyon TaxID=15368 RepID=A0A2K2CZN5_BRADI|nr:hypothetical protein BRADI_3g27917v3 [Brachypodium distachyon]
MPPSHHKLMRTNPLCRLPSRLPSVRSSFHPRWSSPCNCELPNRRSPAAFSRNPFMSSFFPLHLPTSIPIQYGLLHFLLFLHQSQSLLLPLHR